MLCHIGCSCAVNLVIVPTTTHCEDTERNIEGTTVGYQDGSYCCLNRVRHRMPSAYHPSLAAPLLWLPTSLYSCQRGTAAEHVDASGVPVMVQPTSVRGAPPAISAPRTIGELNGYAKSCQGFASPCTFTISL